MRRYLWFITAAVLAAGCEAGDEPVVPTPPEESGPATIRAVKPPNGVRRISRRPTFAWTLPKPLMEDARVTFILADAGTGAEPVTDEAGQRRIATVTGLDASSPEALDLWDPPGGCVLTGEVTDMRQLAPETWYRWRVRAVALRTAAHADFYFRTRDTSAVPVP